MTAGIEATGLRLSRGGKQVLDDVSLRVDRGQVLGLLGRNGAGKTTTLKILCGLLTPDSGTVERPAGKIGSLIETPGFYPNLTAMENLQLFSSDRSARARLELERSLTLVGLASAGDKPVGRYSLGMRQRLGIARALAGRPEVVILDEPSNGLDPHGIKDIRDLIRSLSRDQGTTVIVSSHILSEVELVADVVTVIEEGRTVETLDLPRLGALTSGSIEVEVDRPHEAASHVLKAWSSAQCEVALPNRIFVTSVAEGPGAINSLLVRQGHQVSLLLPRRWSLETHVMHLMKKDQ